MKSDSIGDRMKEYEQVSRLYLTRRMPVIIRLDGKSFHTYTRGMKRPFDMILMTAMKRTMKFLCEHIQNCVFGYTQSDEITLVLVDYKTISTDAWFGNAAQKISSVSSSMATMAFNKFFAELVDNLCDELHEAWNVSDEELKYGAIMESKLYNAMFDARAYTIPQNDVCNCLIWRQQDATRNSIQSVSQANFSRQELHGKSCDKLQDMLWKEREINWNDFPVDCKRGSCCYRESEKAIIADGRNPESTVEVTRQKWIIDSEPPIFTQNREYIERFL